MSNSIGNLKNSGLQGNNFPWQLKMLQGQQCACDYLKEIDLNTDQVEPLLVQILAAIQQGTDYEAALVVDANDVTWLEIRIWNGTTFDPPIYFLAGSNTPGTPVAPITYINPNTYLAQIVSNTTGLATEVTLGDIKTSVQLIDNCVGTDNTIAPANSFVVAGVTSTGVQQTIEVNASGHVNIADGGGSITVDGTVSLSTATLTALENITVQNGAGAAAVNIQDGGNSITVDGTVAATQSGTWNIAAVTGPVALPTGAATELTLAAVNTKLIAAARTPNILTDIGVGSTPTGVYSFSIANVGTAAGLVNGQSVPAGVTLNFDGGSLNNTLNSLPYDASGTIFIITFVS